MRAFLVAAIALASLGPAAAQSPGGPVAVVVEVPIPAGVPRARVVAGIERSVPEYRALPGLVRKYFTLNETSFGGIYLWESRAAAEAWFSPDWHARVQRTYGAPGRVTYFDAIVVMEGETARPAR